MIVAGEGEAFGTNVPKKSCVSVGDLTHSVFPHGICPFEIPCSTVHFRRVAAKAGFGEVSQLILK